MFGLHRHSRLLKFSGFREESTLKATPSGYSIPELGRSGRQYQLCYNLKGVFEGGGLGSTVWRMQEAAFYHRFDVIGGNMLWIVTKGRLDIHRLFGQMTGTGATPENKKF